MQVINLCKELGIKFGDMKKGITPVAENLDINMRQFRPMSKLTEQAVEDIRFIFKDKENPDYTFVTPSDDPIGRSETPAPTLVETAPVVVPVQKKPATKPWKPSKLLLIPEQFKEKGFEYRWCSKDRPGNIRKKQSEGWVIDKVISKKMKDMGVPTVI